MSSILWAARDAWLGAADFRCRRERYKHYTYGDQWSDIVEDESGRHVPEYDYISRSGRKPLTNNMIRQLVKTIIGRYRNACDEGGIYDMSKPYIRDNALAELDCRMLEEFLISGCAIQRVTVEERHYGKGLWIDNVDPRMFFVNPYKDPRGRDIDLIGMLHDMTLPEVIMRFAPNSRRRAAALSRLFVHNADPLNAVEPSPLGRASEGDNFLCAPAGRCRIIEVWTLDCRGSKERRKSLDFVWRCRWFAPDGTLIATYDSPYAHRSHPFVLKFYPLTDGEVHSFVEDVIDQQRFINRLIVMIDHTLGASAKGVLLFPVNQKPKTIEWEDIADTWAKANGVIPITGVGTELPRQVVTSTADSGAYQMLSLQMKLLDNISGVSDAIAGRSVAPATGNALYENQLRSSVIALADLLETFAAFRESRNLKAEQCKF